MQGGPLHHPCPLIRLIARAIVDTVRWINCQVERSGEFTGFHVCLDASDRPQGSDRRPLLYLGMRREKIIEQHGAAETITVPGETESRISERCQRLSDRLRKG